jgi:hypothetical protein
MGARIGAIASVGCIACLAAPPAGAAPERGTFADPVEFRQLNPCNGELVTFTGTVHGRTQTLIDPQGREHRATHVRFAVTGVGDDGGRYRYLNQQHETVSSAATLFPLVITAVQHQRIAAVGSAPNWSARLVVHLTIDADGEVVADVRHERETCRG